jgi:hypothetical protein
MGGSYPLSGYPAVYPEDLRAEARDFYRRFYRIELDDGQFEALSQ